MDLCPPDPSDSFGAAFARLPVVILDPAAETRYVSPTAAALVGMDTSPPADLGGAVAPADVDRVAEAFVSVLDGEGSGTGVSFRGTGTERDAVFEATLYAYSDGPTVEGVVVSLTDVTRPRRFQRALLSVAHPDGGVATARTREGVVARLTALTDDLGGADTGIEIGCYLRGDETAALRPVGSEASGYRRGAAGADAPDADQDDESRDSGSGEDDSEVEPVVRDAARTGELTPVPADAFPLAALPGTDFAGGVAVPLGDYGVLVAGARREGDLTADLCAFLQLVASTTALALDRVGDRRALRRTRRENQRYRAACDRLAAAVDVERRAERRILAATSTSAVQQAVCSELAAADEVSFAWFGTVTSNGDLEVRASAGDGGGFLSTLSFAPAADVPPEDGPPEKGDDPPVTRVVTERRTVSERDISAGFESVGWRREALDAGFRSVVAHPVGGDDATHGVLVCYGRSVGAFDGPVGAAVEQAARTAEHALSSIELRALALGNTTVELVLSIPTSDALLSELAAVSGGTVRFESATVTREGPIRVFVVVDAAAEAVVDAAREIEGVVDATHLRDRDDGAVLEVVYDGRTVPGTLASLGAVVTDAETTDDGVRATVTVSRSTGVRQFVDSVRETYPGTSLLARRTQASSFEANVRFRDRVESSLTDRQLETLQTAHYGGYFASPRSRTGSEVAAMLDITQPTFASHLREAQRKLLELLFESA